MHFGLQTIRCLRGKFLRWIRDADTSGRGSEQTYILRLTETGSETENFTDRYRLRYLRLLAMLELECHLV